MKYLLFLGVTDTLGELVKRGLELFTDTDKAFTSVLIQLTATIILFLAVRFLLWDKVTSIIEEKERREKEAFDALNQAKKDTEEIYIKANEERENARKEALEIIEKAKEKSYIEAEEIVKKAKIEAGMKLEQAREEIDLEVKKANGQIKKEIVEVAYVLAEKIINKEIDEKKYEQLVDGFIKGLEND